MKYTTLLLFSVSLFVTSTFAASDFDMNGLEALLKDTTTKTGTGTSATWGINLHKSANKVLDQAAGDTWKYAGAEKTETADIMADGLTIKTTEIMYNGKSVEKYRVYYAESSLASIQDTSKIKDMIVSPSDKKDSMVNLKLTGLKADTMYYIVVAPVDPTNPSAEPLSMISDEINARTAKVTWMANADKNPSAVQGFENVSYDYKGNTVTLTWSPMSTASNVDVQVRHQSETSYKKVGSAKGSVGMMKFDVTKSGNYFLKLTATDANGAMIGKEHIQTVKVDSVDAPQDKPVVQTAPKVGPASNMLFGIGFFALLLYVVYRFRRIEA